MNCISGSLILICLLACTACGAPASEPTATSSALTYSVHYTVTPDANEGIVRLEMQVQQDNDQLKELAFEFPRETLSKIHADDGLTIDGDTATWSPGRDGGTLSWIVHPSKQRRNDGFDALMTGRWGIFRAEDIIPRARTRTTKGATSLTTIEFSLPPGWSAVSEYSSIDSRNAVENPKRHFDQPSGWIAVGELGVRRDTIAGTRITIAAPQGESVRRMDMLALLNWTLPELTEILPEPMPRLTIVSAGDPMWRGGLSAPASLFIHAERPLISENATSTLIHEVIHVAFDFDAADGYDWIVEGLAEYYSLELLHRGAAITTRRYQRALEKQAEWANDATTLCRPSSAGATTALGVTVFRQLNEELESRSNGTLNLDAIVQELNGHAEDVTLKVLQQKVASMLTEPSETLQLDNLPGCEAFANATGGT